MKDVRHERPYVVSSHLCEMSSIGESIQIGHEWPTKLLTIFFVEEWYGINALAMVIQLRIKSQKRETRARCPNYLSHDLLPPRAYFIRKLESDAEPGLEPSP